MSQIRCHHCRAHLATTSPVLFTLEAMPRIIDRIVQDHRKHCAAHPCPGCGTGLDGRPWCRQCNAALADIHSVWTAPVKPDHYPQRPCGNRTSTGPDVANHR